MMWKEPDYFPCDECKPLFQGLVDDFLEAYSHVSKQLAIAQEALKSIRFHYNVWSTGHGPDVESTCVVLGQIAAKVLDKLEEMG